MLVGKGQFSDLKVVIFAQQAVDVNAEGMCSCLWVYIVVDDVFKEVEKHVSRPGPAPVCCLTA